MLSRKFCLTTFGRRRSPVAVHQTAPLGKFRIQNPPIDHESAPNMQFLTDLKSTIVPALPSLDGKPIREKSAITFRVLLPRFVS